LTYEGTATLGCPSSADRPFALVTPRHRDPMPGPPAFGQTAQGGATRRRGQFVGKRVGSARARMREERSDDRSPATVPRC